MSRRAAVSLTLASIGLGLADRNLRIGPRHDPPECRQNGERIALGPHQQARGQLSVWAAGR